jgi:hypothetical protein
MELIREYLRSDISLEVKKQILKQLSDSYFDESPVKNSSSVKSRQAEKGSPKVQTLIKTLASVSAGSVERQIQTKSTDVLEFRELMDQEMSKTTKSTVNDKVCDEQLLEKYMKCLLKFNKGHSHIVAMVMHLLYAKEAMGTCNIEHLSSNRLQEAKPDRTSYGK